MVLALKELSIRGDFRTTVEYLIKVMESEAFMNHKIDTEWLDARIAQNDQVRELLLVFCFFVFFFFWNFINSISLDYEIFSFPRYLVLYSMQFDSVQIRWLRFTQMYTIVRDILFSRWIHYD